MDGLLALLGMVVVWVVLIKFVLPRLGIPT